MRVPVYERLCHCPFARVLSCISTYLWTWNLLHFLHKWCTVRSSMPTPSWHRVLSNHIIKSNVSMTVELQFCRLELGLAPVTRSPIRFVWFTSLHMLMLNVSLSSLTATIKIFFFHEISYVEIFCYREVSYIPRVQHTTFVEIKRSKRDINTLLLYFVRWSMTERGPNTRPEIGRSAMNHNNASRQRLNKPRQRLMCHGG